MINNKSRPYRIIEYTVAATILGSLWALLVVSEIKPVQEFAFLDFYDYYFAAEGVLEGRSPYDTAYFYQRAVQEGVPFIKGSTYIYPPWVVSIFFPLTVVSPRAAATVWFILSALILLFMLGDMSRSLDKVNYKIPWVLLGVLFPATLFTLFVGQVNIVLLGLIYLVWRYRHKQPIVAGISLGLAVSLKINPVLLFVPLFFARQYKVVAVAMATGLVCLGVGEFLVPGSTIEFITRVLPAISAPEASHAHPVNQGLKGFMMRLLVANDWTFTVLNAPRLAQILTFIISLLLTGFFIYRTLSSSRERNEEFHWVMALGLSIILSPLAWESLFVLLLLPLALLIVRGAWRPAVFVSALVIAQRFLDVFANNPEAIPLLKWVSPLVSLAFMGVMYMFFYASVRSGREQQGSSLSISQESDNV